MTRANVGTLDRVAKIRKRSHIMRNIKTMDFKFVLFDGEPTFFVILKWRSCSNASASSYERS